MSVPFTLMIISPGCSPPAAAGPARLHIADDDALSDSSAPHVVLVVVLCAKVGLSDSAAADQFGDNLIDGVDRNGITDADAAAARRCDRGVDADEPAVLIEQGAAGIARIQRGIGLDHIGNNLLGRRLNGASESANNPLRKRERLAERTADCIDGLSHFEVVRSPHRYFFHAAGWKSL